MVSEKNRAICEKSGEENREKIDRILFGDEKRTVALAELDLEILELVLKTFAPGIAKPGGSRDFFHFLGCEHGFDFYEISDFGDPYREVRRSGLRSRLVFY